MSEIRTALGPRLCDALAPHLREGSRLAGALHDLLSAAPSDGQPKELVRSGSTRRPDRVVSSGGLWLGEPTLLAEVRRRCEAIVQKEMARPSPLLTCRAHGNCRVCKKLDHVSNHIWRHLTPVTSLTVA